MPMQFFVKAYCNNRLFEWVMTGALLGLATLCATWPQSMGASAFRYILSVIGPGSIVVLFAVVGTFRIISLMANGTWPVWGPRIRALSAGLAALIWMQMCIALVLLIPNVETPPSPGIPVYLALTVGELMSCYRVLAENADAARVE